MREAESNAPAGAPPGGHAHATESPHGEARIGVECPRLLSGVGEAHAQAWEGTSVENRALSPVLLLAALRRRVVCLALCTAAVLVADLGRASITDDGQVVLEPDGSLSIGSDAFGRRTVADEADSAYPAASLGLLPGGHGELVLTSGASFETTGQLGVGGQGGALLDVSDGSLLLTGSARLVDYDAIHGYASDPIQARIAGSGTEWNNAGLLQIGSPFALANSEVVVSDGAHLETNGVWATGRSVDIGRTAITVDGVGTSWNNTGTSRISSDASFTVRGGATATDSGVSLGDSYFLAHAVVEGEGSLWRTGAIEINSFSLFNNVGLLVRDGGRVESTSAYLSTQTTQQAIVRGAGSAWNISGRLMALSNDAGGDSHVRVEQGGLLETGESQVGGGGGGYASATVIGLNSTFRNAGELFVTGGIAVGATFRVLDGGQATTKSMRVDLGAVNNTTYGGIADVRVDGDGSLLTVVEDALFSSDPSNPDGKATWTVGEGGRVEVGGSFTVEDSARVSLAGGTVSAALLALHAGALTGDGLVQSVVENAGLVAPGASIGGMTIDGSYTQEADGALSITLGGLAPGVSHDIIEVLGASVLAGRLLVELESGYLPNLGDSFEILSAASVSGTFDDYEGLDLSPNLSLIVDYLADGVRLVTVPEPGAAMLLMTGLLVLAYRQRRHGTATATREDQLRY